MTSSKRKSGLLKFSSHHRNSNNSNSNSSNSSNSSSKSNFSKVVSSTALGLLDSQPKGGYSAIYTPVKKKLVGGGSGKKKSSGSSSSKKNDVAAIVTPATIATLQPPSSSGRSLSSMMGQQRQSSSSSSFNEEEEAVKVCIRIKPLLNNERRAWTTSPTDVNTIIKTTSSSTNDTTNNNNTAYKFDQVYNENSSTTQIYNDIISDIIYSVCNHGRNGTVFTYGQTSTGKTYTMHGIMKEVGKDLFRQRVDGAGCGSDDSGSREIETDEDGFILRRVSFEPDSTIKKKPLLLLSSTLIAVSVISAIEGSPAISLPRSASYCM